MTDYSPSSSTPRTAANTRHVVIAGAGIHGLSTAYFLSTQHGIRCTLVERTGCIAPGASSKAAGFLAKTWNDDTPSQKLTHRSFDLHQQLADQFGADTIQYRRLQCVGVVIDPTKTKTQPQPKAKSTKKQKRQLELEWRPLNPDVSSIRDMGVEATIAQVHPRLLCEQLWKACQETGLVTLMEGRVVGAQHNPQTGEIQGAMCQDGTLVPGDALLYAAGAWTANIMYGIKGHSLILPTSRVLKQTIFFETKNDGEPEVFVRPDETAFVSGYPGEPMKVTEVAGSETIEQATVDKLVKSVRLCMGYANDDSDKDNTEEIKTKPDDDGGDPLSIAVSKDPRTVQACYQPCTDDYLPIMGKLSLRAAGGDHCFISSGHNCWGILLAPASGEAVADLIATGESKHVDLTPFRPSRYRNLKPVPV